MDDTVASRLSNSTTVFTVRSWTRGPRETVPVAASMVMCFQGVLGAVRT
jgi:hypothetical protein